MKKTLKQYLKTTIPVFLLSGTMMYSQAQIAPNAINADPSAKAISQVPLGANINGTAVLKFKFTNEATSVNGTGQIPPNSVRLTISFPGKFAYSSVNDIPKFFVEDFDTAPFGAVHLVNNATILEGEVIDLLLNVRGTSPGMGTVTFNSDRVTPIIVNNTQTANDNASSTFNTSSVLPVSLASFSVSTKNCDAQLNWKSTDETNFKKYTIEFSADGRSYNAAQSVNGKGDNQEYSLLYSASTNKGYFRLKMINEDGSFEYSDIVSFNSKCAKTLVNVYPNPTTDFININVSVANTDRLVSNLVDQNGRKVLTNKLMNGLNTINVKTLSKGIYLLSIYNAENLIETKRILVE